MDWTPLKDALITLLSNGLQLVLGIAAGYVILFIRRGVETFLRLKQKYGIEISDADQQRFRQIVTDAVYYAEEWAASQAKAGNLPTSSAKYGKALAYVNHFFPKKDSKEVGLTIQATLGSLSGLGASKHLGG